MAKPPVLDRLSNPSDTNFHESFERPQFPSDTPSDLTIPSEFLVDLDLDADLDLDFSFADFLDIPEVEDDLPPLAGGVAPSSSTRSDREKGSGLSSSSSASHAPGGGSLDQSGSLSPPLPGSDDFATCPSDSVKVGSSANEGLVKWEGEERKGWGLKRKKGREDGGANHHTIAKPKERSNKFHMSGPPDEGTSPCLFDQWSEEEQKRRARLMRNRESAHLSRQRKKQYVEELEEKVKFMHSTITELNNRISFVMAENASLRQQLGGGGEAGNCPPPAVYPTPAPVHFPWIPCSAYSLGQQVSQVPLIPIPRLKPQEPNPTPEPRKSESNKSRSKTKKVASVSFLGLLFCMLLAGVQVPGANHRYEGSGGMVLRAHSFGNGKLMGQSRGRTLAVTGNSNRSNLAEEVGARSGKIVPMGDYGDQMVRGQQQAEVVSGFPGNASKSLFASLFVPRNDKLVKIDGNLIIHSVLASERGMSHSASGAKRVGGQRYPDKEGPVEGNSASALAIPKSRRDMNRQAGFYRAIAERQRALPHGWEDKRGDGSQSTFANGPVKEWFREGLEGPLLSSGMCTEVFQFDVSPTSSAGISPATSIANVTDKQSNDSPHPGNVERRSLHPQPAPLAGTTHNKTEGSFGKPPETGSFHSNNSASPVVVSVLMDPREAGDSDGGRMFAPKSISKIFVVVLLDSVKYVTYSCVLPFKSAAPHLQP